MRSTSTSLLKKHKFCVLIFVVLLIILVITSVFLYTNTHSYYFEQNMHMYAMGETYSDVNFFMASLANQVNSNKSALNQLIPQNSGVLDEVDRLQYMDPSHGQDWYALSGALHGLLEMAYDHYFHNESTGWVAQVYQDILSLANAFVNVPLGMWGFAPSGSYLYNQNANTFAINETTIQNVGQISIQIQVLIRTNLG